MKCIMLKHDITRHYDMTLNIALMYSIRYTEFETEEGYVLSFRLKEEINDLRTFTYFQNLLCYIFNTEPSNQNYCSLDTYEVSIYNIMLAFVDRVRSNYDERHYKEVIRRENKKADIEIIDSMPAIYKLKNGDYTLTPTVEYVNKAYIGEMPAPENEIQKQAITRNKNKRAVYRNFNFNDLKGHIITTHARLLHMKNETLDNHTVIIDEDILRTSINTNSVSINDLKTVYKAGIFKSDIQERLKYLCMNHGYHKLDGLYFSKDEDILKKIAATNSNIIDLLSSEYVYITSDAVHYLTDSPLPHNKLIILSATASKELYKMYFPDRTFHFYECHKAKYAGRIIQHTNCSYSGYILEKKPDMVSRLYNSAKDDVIITFKNIEHEFCTKYHFGNVEGLNILGGKNLSVIGLPNKPDYVYCLYGMRAGMIIDKYPNMYVQRVEWNGYNFSLNTFKDKTLQTIQMWILSSQLEQAAGRARLLRNDCTVTVYAGFPVEQAKFSY